MNIDKTHNDRIAIQATTDEDIPVVEVAHAIAAILDDVVGWYTLDIEEYPELDHSLAFAGQTGEKALVITERGGS